MWILALFLVTYLSTNLPISNGFFIGNSLASSCQCPTPTCPTVSAPANCQQTVPECKCLKNMKKLKILRREIPLQKHSNSNEDDEILQLMALEEEARVKREVPMQTKIEKPQREKEEEEQMEESPLITVIEETGIENGSNTKNAELERSRMSPKCNSQVLKKLMMENMTNNSRQSKQSISLAAEHHFGGNVDVICSKDHFTYLYTSALFCEATNGIVNCIAFRQPNGTELRSEYI